MASKCLERQAGEAMPRVMYLTAGYHRSGGIEVYLLHYATEMRRRGFDVRIVACDPLPSSPHWCLREVRARKIPIRSLAGREDFLLGGLLPFAAGWAVVRTLRWPGWTALRRALIKRQQGWRLRALIRRWQPAIIHVKGRIASEFLPILPPGRTVFHIATSGALDASWSPVEVVAIRSFAEHCARVFAPGSGVAERFKREFQISREVDVIFTMSPDGGMTGEGGSREKLGGASLQHGASCSGVRLGFLGRLAPGKGLPETLEALRILKQEGICPPFAIVGAGILEVPLRAFIMQHGLTHVTMVGEREPREALRCMDVLVLASESEAMPLVLVEAMASGHPCLATAVGGVPDLIRDGQEGFLLRDHAPATIAEGIRSLLALSPEALHDLSLRARKRYENCCRPEAVGTVVEGIYRQIICKSANSITK